MTTFVTSFLADVRNCDVILTSFRKIDITFQSIISEMWLTTHFVRNTSLFMFDGHFCPECANVCTFLGQIGPKLGQIGQMTSHGRHDFKISSGNLSWNTYGKV